MTYRLLPGSFTIFVILLLLTGCAGPRVSPSSPRGVAPSSNNVVPPTQKPYRIMGKTYYPIPSAQGFQEKGLASWYGGDFHGRKTSNGETYNMYGDTAAHKTLPMGTYLLVTNLENGKETTIRVNDRGPFHKGRIIDMTKSGAEKLGFIAQGTAKVRITALGEAVTYHRGNQETKIFKEHPDFQSGDFYVQIGSFIDENNAGRLREKMVATGYQCVIEKFARGDKTFYRVQVRAGSDLGAAKRLERKLNSGQFPDTFVVAR